MTQDITIGTARAARPGKATGYLQTGSAPDGTAIEIPVIILRGERPGKTLWLHGCVHGNEYCGTFILHELIRSLDPATLSGTLVALPSVNLPAFQARQRVSPYEIYHGADLNRQFPGDAKGSHTQQMAAKIYAELKRHADVFIDFHTAVTPDVRWALFPKLGGEVEAVSEKVARAFGYRDTLPVPPDVLKGSAMMTAAGDGIPSFIVECGGKMRAFTDEAVTDAVARLRNAMTALGMLEGEVKNHGKMNFFSNFAWVTTTEGGMFEKAVSCGDRLEVGTVIGTYYDAWGNRKSEARSPRAGIVLAIHPGPTAATGETLVHIGLDPRDA